MRSTQHRQQELRRERATAIVETQIQALFRRVPMLCGFTVQEDLELADVAVHTWPGYGVGVELYEEVLQALADLVEERPDAAELLRGRTFARLLQ